MTDIPAAGQRFLDQVYNERQLKEAQIQKKNEEWLERQDEREKKRCHAIIKDVLEGEASRCYWKSPVLRWNLIILICLCIPVFGWAFLLLICAPCNTSTAISNRERVLKAAREGDTALAALRNLDEDYITQF